MISVFRDFSSKILHEESRNGRIMREELIQQNDLKIVNETEKCKGKYTRVDTDNPQERSTIDYCIVTHKMWNQIIMMDIDECQQYKLKGKKQLTTTQ